MSTSRINWKKAFTKLCDNSALTPTDRKVIESMRQHWEKGKPMSAARKRYFLSIQERTDKAAAAMLERAGGKQTELGRRLETIRARMVCDQPAGWSHGFIESLISQESRGAKLSPRQIEILEKIEGDWTDEKITFRATFAKDYANNKNGMKDDFGKVMLYYKANPPYFRNDVLMWSQSSDYIPDCDIYNKVVRGKYGQKILDGYNSKPKFEIGTLVYPKTNSSMVSRKVLKRGGFVLSTTETITAAAKGNKTYNILPIGSAVPVKVQERFLKGRP